MTEYIKREDAIKAIKNYGKGAISDGLVALDPVDDIVALVNAMEWLSTEDVEPVKHGHWVADEADVLFHCSECETQISTSWDYEDLEWNYCPNCGQRMTR